VNEVELPALVKNFGGIKLDSERACTVCGDVADYSILMIMTTLRVVPRGRANTKAIPICRKCCLPSTVTYKGLKDSLAVQAFGLSNNIVEKRRGA